MGKLSRILIALLVATSLVGCADSGGDAPDSGPSASQCADDAECAPRYPDLGPCQVARCVEQACVVEDAADGGSCGDAACDGGVFTAAAVCEAGVCQTSKKTSCDDGDPCTDDACDAAKGCASTPNTAPCNDGDACTTGDVCADGSCQAGAAKDCDDANPCTKDTCDSGTGGCANAAAADGDSCDDGNACTTDDTCGASTAGVCGGQAKGCDDGDPCTKDTCDPKSGCVNAAKSGACDDGDPCTTGDACGDKGCAGQPVDAKKLCDDSDPCTDEVCAAGKGCENPALSGVACDDGNPCTSGDACDAGSCKPGANTCQCTQDSDCKASANLCLPKPYCDKASNKCVTDPKTAVSCDTSKDGACAKTACEPTTGKCVKTNGVDGASCDADGSLCTVKDACAAGACVAGAALSCDDKNPCSDDSCDPKQGCVTKANAATCDDGDACTTKDACQGNKCTGGPALQCDDGKPCTQNSCDKAKGCTTADKAGPCDDGDPCTTGDSCAGGACKAGQTKSCDDGKPCTKDSCDPKTGQCASTAGNDGGACDDGDPCTASGACKSGTCQGGKPKSCDDGKICTADSCDSKTGCVHTPLDGCNPCASGPTCAGAALPSWTLEDKNPTSSSFGKGVNSAAFKGKPFVIITVYGY